jgi:hypothetical protein
MNNEEEKQSPTEEELEELIKELKKLEEQKKKGSKKKPKGILMIEFGGVYHPNFIVNFLFSMIINITLAYVIISLFQFAYFEDLVDYIYFILAYSVIEWIVREFITRKYLSLIIKSFGMILYFSYIFIAFMLDHYLFNGNVTFHHETQLVAFVTIFVIIRYIIGTSIRRYFRKQVMR